MGLENCGRVFINLNFNLYHFQTCASRVFKHNVHLVQTDLMCFWKFLHRVWGGCDQHVDEMPGEFVS